MTILAQFKNQDVEVLNVYNSGGVKYAAVRAITGKPFTGGDKWPIYTEWATAATAELAHVRIDSQPEPERSNLLTLALAQEKPQWESGESVTLVTDRKGRPLAFLKNLAGRVCLCLAGYDPHMTIFILRSDGWQVCSTVGADYRQWAAKAQAARSWTNGR